VKEFIVGISAFTRGDLAKKIPIWFSVFDLDHDGVLRSGGAHGFLSFSYLMFQASCPPEYLADAPSAPEIKAMFNTLFTLFSVGEAKKYDHSAWLDSFLASVPEQLDLRAFRQLCMTTPLLSEYLGAGLPLNILSPTSST
jgi:hypothetical protein